MIDKVGSSCTGCGACEAICPVQAIEFRYNENLFTYPEIDYDKCIKCNLCDKTCPILNDRNDFSFEQTSFAAYTDQKPSVCSSGGVFYKVAEEIIRNHGKVYGAYMSEDLVVRHRGVNNIDDIGRLCGSKYIQSYISPEVFRSINQTLKAGVQVLFVGTPCQVEALKLFIRRPVPNLCTVDLICHGVPSPKIFSDYIHYCQRLRLRKIKGFLCRDNREGWDNLFKSTIFYSHGKEEYNTGLSNLWNRIFFSELITRKSCNHCKFCNYKRVGDITLGDFWGKEKIEGKDVRDGISLCLSNTSQGERILGKCGLIMEKAVTNEREHPNLYHPTPMNPKSKEFIEYYSREGFSKAINKYFGFNWWLDMKLRIHAVLSKLKYS